jgi:TPP-dependent pyruvate/acetoin dehydrogenase alpha subunit
MAVRSPPSSFDRWHAYRWMYLSRRFEEITKRLWMEGLISGEMHLGMG